MGGMAPAKGGNSADEHREQALDTIAEGVTLVDASGAITYANRSATEMFGLDRTLVVDRTYNDPRWRITKPCGSPMSEHELPFSRVMSEGTPIAGLEMAIEREDGTRVILSVNAAPTYGADGALTGMIASFRDVTELWRAQRLVEEQKEFLERQVRQRTRELERAKQEVIEKLALAAEYRDDDTGEHAERVAKLSAEIARELGLKDGIVDRLRKAALLHDVGKIAIPDAILLKQGKLTEAEFEVMKTHAVRGAELLAGSQSKVLVMATVIANYHHENWDGSGYLGVAGENIPLVARIVSVSDVYDALSSDRPYRAAWPRQEVLQEIRRQSGRKFDPTVVEAFLRVVDAAAGEARADEAA